MSKKIDTQGPNILTADGKGPWDSSDSPDVGSTGNSTGRGSGSKPEPVNPWDPTPDPATRTRSRGPSLEELLRRKGGGFGGLPQRPDGKSWWPIIVGGIVALWLVWTSIHRIGPEQEGVVTQLGKYSRTVQPGIQSTLPAPLESITKIDTKQIQTTSVGSP